MQFAVTIGKTKQKGRGVFATKNFKTGEIIEACPIIKLSTRQRLHGEKTALAYYMYPWKSERDAAVVLGYGSIYNHSHAPNAEWKPNFKTTHMVYVASRPIKKGEEITVNYNGNGETTQLDWFEVK